MGLQELTTESRNPKTAALDRLPTEEILRLINEEDKTIAFAVEEQIPQIARAVEVLVAALSEGGRLFYVGAGTSGRLGVLDAAECPPTFGTDPELVQGLIAGGTEAVFRSQESVEDDCSAGARDLEARGLRSVDVVVGISASGRTPYVLGALEAARKLRAATIGVTCNKQAEMAPVVDVLIAPVVGSEVVTGSTRMKAGTAEKMVLNMLSTATMVRLGRVESNLMADLQTRSGKLRNRAVRIVSLLAQVPPERAGEALNSAGGNVRAAVRLLSQGADT